MIRTAKLALVAAALSTTALSPLALAAQAQAQPPATASIAVPPIAYQQRVLANGMKVSLNLPASRVNVGPTQGRASFVEGAAVSNQQGGMFRSRGAMYAGNAGNLGTRTFNRFDGAL